MIRITVIMMIMCSCGSVDPTPINPYEADTTSCYDAAKHLEFIGCEDELYVEDSDEMTDASLVDDWIDYCKDSKTLAGMDEPTNCLADVISCDEIDGCYGDR